MSAKPVRYGCTEPRIFTPPLRELTPETTDGFAVVEFAVTIGVELLPWEEWLLIHALELNPDGTYRFRTVLLLVARQNGKSLVMQVLTMWRMFVDAARLVIGTAQNLDTSYTQWEEVIDTIRAIPELDEQLAKVDRTNGLRAMRLVGGEKYKVASATRRGGRGLSGDLVLLDELREHTNWDSWGAVTKTTMARQFAQIWGASNAGDLSSIVLRYLRNLCHAALGNPDNIEDIDAIQRPETGEDEEDYGLSIGIFEWSAPPGCSVWYRPGWAQANPSLGYLITERAIAAAAGTDPEWVFRTEVLCQWRDTKADGPFPEGQWEAGLDVHSKRDGRFMFCVDTSHDRTTTYIGVAARRADGLMHVEVVAQRSGTAWVKPWLTERKTNPDLLGVALQANGAPVSSLLSDLESIEGLNVIPWAGSDLGRGTGMFYDLVRGPLLTDDDGNEIEDKYGPPLLRHRRQPALDLAAQQAVTRPSGDAWLWDRKASPVDIAPLVAVTGAVWAFLAAQPAPKKRSKYEDQDLLVI